MKLLVYKDKLITEKEILRLQSDFTKIYSGTAGITPEFIVEDYDYTEYPTYLDSDGDGLITVDYLTKLTNAAFNKYANAVDHIIVLIHRDNWKLPGLWGTNFSNIYREYHVQICRFDNKNAANSLGTLYHEVHHSHDALIKTMLGVDINPIVGVKSWDTDVTHGGRTYGGHAKWKYIRYNENLEALAIIAPYLRDAYKKRRDLYTNKTTLMKQVITLAQRYLTLLRARQNKKDGVVQ